MSSLILPECFRSHAVGRAAMMTRSTQMADPHGWKRCHAAMGPDVHLWTYMEWKLKEMLSSTRKIGQAGYAWQGPGKLVFGFIAANGCSQAEQSAPYAGETISYWPMIFLAPPNGIWDGHMILPTYCQALAAQGARAWFGHGSRCWGFPLDWLLDLPCPVAPTQIPAQMPMFAAAPATTRTANLSGVASSVSSSTTPLPVAPTHIPFAAAPSTTIMTASRTSSFAIVPDIANLEDVASMCDGYSVAETSVSSTTEASGNAASSSASTALSEAPQRIRRNRWTKYSKKDPPK